VRGERLGMNSFDTALVSAFAGRVAHAGDGWLGFALAGEVLGGWAAPAGRVWPGGHSLSFASPKERKQRKSEPAVCDPTLRFGQPAVLALTGVSLELGYRLKQSRALIRPKLCSSAQTEGHRAAQSARLVALRATLPGYVFAADELASHLTTPRTHKSTSGDCFTSQQRQCLNTTKAGQKPGFHAARAQQSAERFAAVEAGLSSAGAGGKRAGDCLSEARSSQTPPDTSSARHRAAARTSARLSFAYFSLAKQRKVSGRRAIPGLWTQPNPQAPRPPGRNPASGSQPPSQRPQNHATCRHTACIE